MIMALLTSFAPLAGLIGAALGSIIFGLATPSEAAAMGSLGALLLAVGYGADYSQRWNVLLVQVFGLLAAAFLVYLIVCGFTAAQRRSPRGHVACSRRSWSASR